MNRRLLVAVIVLSVACTRAQPERPAATLATDAAMSFSCMQQTIVQLGDQYLVITLKDAEQIRAAAEKYLHEAKPKLDGSIARSGDAFIDCEGVVRMGPWLLERQNSDSGLSLSYRVAMTDFVLVREIITLQRLNGEWKAVSIGQSVAHKHY